MSEERKKDDSIGALWSRESANGKVYLTGKITIDVKETNIVCFRVSSQHPKAPMWRILKSKPREQDQRASERADVGDVGPGAEDYE